MQFDPYYPLPDISPSRSRGRTYRDFVIDVVLPSWMASGLSLVALTVPVWIFFRSSGGRPPPADGSYIISISFVLSCVVGSILLIGRTMGFWFRSSRIGGITIFLLLASIVAFLTFLWFHIDPPLHLKKDFYAITLWIYGGALVGSTAFLVRKTSTRWILSTVPQLLVGIGYLIAVTSA